MIKNMGIKYEKYDLMIKKMEDIRFLKDLIGSSYIYDTYDSMVKEVESHME